MLLLSEVFVRITIKYYKTINENNILECIKKPKKGPTFRIILSMYKKTNLRTEK